MSVGFIVCSRLDSTRIPNKPIKKINGEYLLSHLIKRLNKTELKTILAVPTNEYNRYKNYFPDVTIFDGPALCPLRRMYECAMFYGLDTIIRVSHDKIFIDDKAIFEALAVFKEKNLDYLYSTKFLDGCSFEIISFDALAKASSQFNEVEYIGYAIKSVTKNILGWDPPAHVCGKGRLLVDYPEDLTAMETILQRLGNDCHISTVKTLLKNAGWIMNINKLPILTIYTCGYNAEKFLAECVKSVLNQHVRNSFQFILIDDFSTDSTPYLMAKYRSQYSDMITYHRNQENLGLSSSCNVALKMAKGKYIMRLDADDFFVGGKAVQTMIDEIASRGLDAVYPNNYFGKMGLVENGKKNHHVGGAIFRTRAINHVKFTDRLRGYEGLDFFERAKDQLNIGYLNKPMFFYRQHEESLTKNNVEEREALKQEILGDEDLIMPKSRKDITGDTF